MQVELHAVLLEYVEDNLQVGNVIGCFDAFDEHFIHLDFHDATDVMREHHIDKTLVGDLHLFTKQIIFLITRIKLIRKYFVYIKGFYHQ